MLIIGHRGACGLAPENTIASFKKALEYNVDVIEFDLRVTEDKEVIVHHEKFLADLSGNRLLIKRTTYNELKSHKPDLPTLNEVLDFLRDKVPVFIDVKQSEEVRPIVAILKKYIKNGWPMAHITIGSKSQKTLLEVHAQLPQVKKRVIDRWSGLRAIIRAKQLGTNLIVMHERWLWAGFISGMSRRGYELYPYPLNDPKKAKRWAKHGLAGVVTDFPDRFKR